MPAIVKRLDASFLQGRRRPTPRILQFGGGNFLRGFLDWKIDRLNETTGADWGVVIVRSTGDGGASLNEQDGLFTTLVRGVDEQGRPVSEPHLVACVRREVSATSEWPALLELARNPAIALITSNTTEAGIVFDPACGFDDAPPASFPAKLTRLMWERWSSGGRDAAPGFQILPCELIDHNGEELRRCVLRHVEGWDLAPEFAVWVEMANVFYNTLVDRIVPGFPRTEAEPLAEELGYRDSFMTAAELFHLLVIERKPGMPAPILPLEGNDEGTIVVEDAGPYKERKVAILNGAHTALCPLALLAGIATVREAVTDEAGAVFLDRLLAEEVLPYLSLPRAETEAFAAAVRRRFANPFIRHLWYDISLTGIAKFRTRNLPRLLAHLQANGAPPRLTSLSLAAWAVFYMGLFPGADGLPPRDSAELRARFDRLKAIEAADGTDAMVGAYLADAELWGQPLTDVEGGAGLQRAVADGIRFLTEQPFSFARLAAFLQR